MAQSSQRLHGRVWALGDQEAHFSCIREPCPPSSHRAHRRQPQGHGQQWKGQQPLTVSQQSAGGGARGRLRGAACTASRGELLT